MRQTASRFWLAEQTKRPPLKRSSKVTIQESNILRDLYDRPMGSCSGLWIALRRVSCRTRLEFGKTRLASPRFPSSLCRERVRRGARDAGHARIRECRPVPLLARSDREWRIPRKWRSGYGG